MTLKLTNTSLASLGRMFAADFQDVGQTGMALDQSDLQKRIEAGCTARIVRSGPYFVVVLDGPAPCGVVCFGNKPKQFPSPQHAVDWLARLGVSMSAPLR